MLKAKASDHASRGDQFSPSKQRPQAGISLIRRALATVAARAAKRMRYAMTILLLQVVWPYWPRRSCRQKSAPLLTSNLPPACSTLGGGGGGGGGGRVILGGGGMSGHNGGVSGGGMGHMGHMGGGGDGHMGQMARGDFNGGSKLRHENHCPR